MDLTAERFAALILSLNAHRVIDRARENRAEQRNGVRYRILIKIPGLPASQTHRAWMRDFSSTGLCMAVLHPINPGQAFAVQFQSAAGVVEVPCTTAHCQRAAEDVYHVGARFMDRWYTKLPQAA